ncbi:DUF6230 family protein [Nocardiopsis rhodophaea]|uniref:DUF6230 family protein n=1 Tax=Nocardiopsis rhodophaea TaxID=280238 RepID=A0ABN2T6N5_9ACTN
MSDDSVPQATEGGTRWRKFGLALIPGLAAAGILGGMTTQGMLAASFAVSGDSFKLSADSLRGQGFAQYGDVATSVDDTSRPVGLSVINTAELDNLCMSSLVDLPIGEATLLIKAGESRPVEASSMVVDVEQLDGNASFDTIEIGRDASTLDKISGPKGPAGAFGLQSDSAVIDDLQLTAWSVNSGTLKLAGLKLGVQPGKHECF